MSNIPFKYFSLSAGILLAGSIGGWALTHKLAGWQDSVRFVFCAIAVVSGLLLFQGVLCFRSVKGLYFHLLFVAGFGLSLVWFMMCLILPLMWIDTVDMYIRMAVLVLIVPLCVSNVLESFRRFHSKWMAKGEQVFSKAFDSKRGTVNWDKVIKPLELMGDIFIPWIPKRVTWIISLSIIPFMLAGMAMRNAFPVFSIFAWGVPSVLIIAFFFQMIGYNLAQAAMVRKLERDVSMIIKRV